MACTTPAAKDSKQGAWSRFVSGGSTVAPHDDSEASVDHIDSNLSATSHASSWSFGWRPKALHHNFNVADVQRCGLSHFAMVRTIQGAPRNRGKVHHMVDMMTGVSVAVKQMPNDWICECHAVFSTQYPEETERPWVDIGCTAFLTSVSYPYVCPLLGVFRDEETTGVVSTLATEGDLFLWAKGCKCEPGPMREAAVLPLVKQMFDAVRILHDLGIVHRDISAENLLVTRQGPDGALRVQLIDFGMATISRFAHDGDRGKPTYQAPEAHAGDPFDGFLADAFATGVVLYGLLVLEYPWGSTKPGACKAFEFMKAKGFRALVARRKCFKQEIKVAQCLSEPVMQLLEGLLTVSPSARLTLGERSCFEGDDRRSVWQESWVQAVQP